MYNIEYNIKDFNIGLLKNIKTLKKPLGNPKTSHKVTYMDALSMFDIETSKVHTSTQKKRVLRDGHYIDKEIKRFNAFMWGWQIQINEFTIKGNYWDEFIGLLKSISSLLREDEYYVIYVHNLSYEFQFLAGVYDFKPEEVFATDKRKILRATMFDHFELRCSYKLTNMSLERWTKEMQVEHPKTKDLDYDELIYPWTKTTPLQERYRTNDVLGGVEALKAQMDRDGDTLYTIPMTSTGYVRRDVKRALKAVPDYSVKDLNPSYDIYKELESAFRGGVTGANRYYIGEIIEDVRSNDKTSSYPTQQTTKLYPIGNFTKIEEPDVEEVLKQIKVRKMAILTGVSFEKLRLKEWDYPAPYLSLSKCQNVDNELIDNGKILEADYLETYITDIDLMNILDIYEFDNIYFFDTYKAHYGKLPQAYIDVIIKYYQRKTELKGVEGEELMYSLNKGLLNGVYGMGVQRIVKGGVIYKDGEFSRDETPEEDKYDKEVKKTFLAYQWGVWITAHARHALYEGINNVRAQGAVPIYWDTDSVKYYEPEEVKVTWDKLNNKLYKEAKAVKGIAYDIKGKEHALGVWDEERPYKRFITYGAKRYAYDYLNDDGSIYTGITVSGVDKVKGAQELTESGGLEAFTENFTFVTGGGTTIQYNDKPEVDYIEDPETGLRVKITRNCAIVNKEYTMGLTEDYRRLLDECKDGEVPSWK